MLPRNSSMPSATELYIRETKSLEFMSWLRRASAGFMAACERKARSSRLRQTAGMSNNSYSSLASRSCEMRRQLYPEILLEPNSPFVQEIFLELEHHLAPRKLEVSHLGELSPQLLVQIMKLAISSRNNPGSRRHLVASTSSDFYDV